ncbi:MAG: ATP-binding protein [Elusimicrobia bacterium]|nr:ATP-binding protein [Elusimicrobiota bacterium]
MLDNACRDTQQGGITLTLEPKDHRFQLVIADTGPGIPQEHLEDLWRPWMRVWPERSRLPGVGLAYVFAVMHDHHGQVQMESHVGQGTTCILTLPSARM